MTLENVLKKKLSIATRKSKLKVVAKLMYQDHVGTVVIIDSNKRLEKVPIGVITDRDITLAYGERGKLPATLTAEDVMKKNVVTCNIDEDIHKTILKMKSHGVRRMPVVDSSGSLAGIIALDDLVEIISAELKSLSDVMKEGVNNEGKTIKSKKIRDLYKSDSSLRADYSEYHVQT